MKGDVPQIQDLALDILSDFPYKPFLCLPISAVLYAKMRDELDMEAHLVTGNFLYKDEFVFKQDFKIEENFTGSLVDWAGHAWVEYDDWIIDLSFFRTLYSDQFTKRCKDELIELFGTGRGLMMIQHKSLEEQGVVYQAIDKLKDETATGIINGIDQLPIWE